MERNGMESNTWSKRNERNGMAWCGMKDTDDRTVCDGMHGKQWYEMHGKMPMNKYECMNTCMNKPSKERRGGEKVVKMMDESVNDCESYRCS